MVASPTNKQPVQIVTELVKQLAEVPKGLAQMSERMGSMGAVLSDLYAGLKPLAQLTHRMVTQMVGTLGLPNFLHGNPRYFVGAVLGNRARGGSSSGGSGAKGAASAEGGGGDFPGWDSVKQQAKEFADFKKQLHLEHRKMVLQEKEDDSNAWLEKKKHIIEQRNLEKLFRGAEREEAQRDRGAVPQITGRTQKDIEKQLAAQQAEEAKLTAELDASGGAAVDPHAAARVAAEEALRKAQEEKQKAVEAKIALSPNPNAPAPSIATQAASPEEFAAAKKAVMDAKIGVAKAQKVLAAIPAPPPSVATIGLDAAAAKRKSIGKSQDAQAILKAQLTAHTEFADKEKVVKESWKAAGWSDVNIPKGGFNDPVYRELIERSHAAAVGGAATPPPSTPPTATAASSPTPATPSSAPVKKVVAATTSKGSGVSWSQKLQEASQQVIKTFLGISAAGQGLMQAASPDTWDTFTGSIKLLAATIGGTLIPFFLQLSAGIQELAMTVYGASDGHKKALGTILAWALGITGALAAVVAVTAMLGTILSPLGLFVAAVGAATYALTLLTDKMGWLKEKESAKDKTSKELEETAGVLATRKQSWEAEVQDRTMRQAFALFPGDKDKTAREIAKQTIRPQVEREVTKEYSDRKVYDSDYFKNTAKQNIIDWGQEAESLRAEARKLLPGFTDEGINNPILPDATQLKAQEEMSRADKISSSVADLRAWLDRKENKTKEPAEERNKMMGVLAAYSTFKGQAQYTDVAGAYKRAQLSALGDDPITQFYKKVQAENLLQMMNDIKDIHSWGGGIFDTLRSLARTWGAQ